MYSTRLRRSRSFHRLGIGVAAAVMAAGLALLSAATFRLDLLDAARGNELAIAFGGALVVLSVLSIAAYGLIRAIEWANRY
jgi:uncharacterized membrane protein (DUF2068 family)